MLTNRYSSRRQHNIKILQQELKSLKVQARFKTSATSKLFYEADPKPLKPLEGFRIENSDESIYKWNVGIFGPPGTIYEGGYFKARINFPMDYPYSPPQLRLVFNLLLVTRLALTSQRAIYLQAFQNFLLKANIRFLTEIFHPNIYDNGEASNCIIYRL